MLLCFASEVFPRGRGMSVCMRGLGSYLVGREARSDAAHDR